MPTPPENLTADLALLKAGDAAGWEALIPKVYNELRRLARSCLHGNSGSQALQPTELVHEAYMRLYRQRNLAWHSRTHFFGVAAHLMRLILTDCARRAHCEKRGGPDACRVDLAAVEPQSQPVGVDPLMQALERLSQLDPRQCRIVEMRFFGGLTEAEIASLLGISEKTVRRDWKVARAWLHGELLGGAREP